MYLPLEQRGWSTQDFVELRRSMRWRAWLMIMLGGAARLALCCTARVWRINVMYGVRLLRILQEEQMELYDF